MGTSLIGLGGESSRLSVIRARRQRVRAVAAASAACFAFLMTGVAIAQAPGDPRGRQSSPEGEKPKTEGTGKPSNSPAPSAADVPAPRRPACGEGELVPGWADQLEASEGSGQPGAAGQKKDSKARWVCEKPTVTLEPVWSGQPLVCDFVLRNDGTENLTIKARGG